MADAPRQYRKHLLSMRGQGPRPKLVTVDDLPTQAEFICTRVLAARESGVQLRRQAVLFRTGAHSDMLEIELTKRKIPFVKYGGLKFLEAAHVKDLLAVLRWADNPRNQIAAFRVLQFMPGMGPANAKAALDHFVANDHQWSSFDNHEPPNDTRIAWRKFVELFKLLADPNREWRGQIALIREWYKPHMERMYEHVHMRIGDLDQLELLSSQYQTRERFVTELTLDPPNATSDQSGSAHHDEDYLVLSTVHSAKGMEWDHVYILNVVDGSFPNEYATKAELVEEERRLLYVAMTRARNELTCVMPLRFQITGQPRTSDGHVYGGRSRFLTEKLVKCFDEQTFQGTNTDVKISETPAADGAIDVASRLKQMW
jgi:DNA helicase-2/ATP-dependent DNA helicase PcrA